jgi:peptidoglycan/LPS O-acetylase OafA/YrhL
MASDRVNSFGFPIHLLHHYQYVWGYTVLNCIAGLLILLVVQGSAPLPFLQSSFLTFIGRISYGIYVYHYGVLAIWQRVGISYLSFHFFESRFLKLKNSHVFGGAASSPALPATAQYE